MEVTSALKDDNRKFWTLQPANQQTNANQN
jgi:hypothetical protein